MSDATSQTVYFYNRHPISCEIILTQSAVGVDRKSFPYEATVIAGKLLMPADLQRLPPVLAGFKDGESHLG